MRGGSFSWILFPFIQKEKTFFLFVSGQESHFLTAGVGRAAGWWRRSPSGLPVGAMRAQEPRAGQRHRPVPQVLRAGAGLPVGAGTWEGPTCSAVGEGSWWQSASRTLSGPPEACELSVVAWAWGNHLSPVFFQQDPGPLLAVRLRVCTWAWVCVCGGVPRGCVDWA